MEIQRAAIMRANNCYFSTLGHDIEFNGLTYKPGILLIGEMNGNQASGINILPDACKEILTDNNVGDFVFIDYIERKLNRRIPAPMQFVPLVTSKGEKIQTSEGEEIETLEGSSLATNIGWQRKTTHIYRIGEFTNKGFKQFEFVLVPIIDYLNKAEVFVWDDKFYRRKFGEDERWFQNIARMTDYTKVIQMT